MGSISTEDNKYLFLVSLAMISLSHTIKDEKSNECEVYLISSYYSFL